MAQGTWLLALGRAGLLFPDDQGNKTLPSPLVLFSCGARACCLAAAKERSRSRQTRAHTGGFSTWH